MEEKKKFILAVPTIIIIIVAIVGISLIFYNRNFKKMSRDDVKTLSQKVANINNISCEIITTTNGDPSTETVDDYKLKDGAMISSVDHFIIYDNEKNSTLMQVDDNEKTVYKYSKYNSEIDNFRKILLTAETLISDEKNEYVFKEYATVNGVKCVYFVIKNENSTFDIWLDKKSGMIVKLDSHYGKNLDSQVTTSMIFRYELDKLTDEEVKEPDTTDYSVIEL